MQINKYEQMVLEKILNEENEQSQVNMKLLKKAFIFKKNYLLTENNDLFLTLDSLIEVNNIVLNKNNTSLRGCQVRPAGFKFEYMHFSKIDFELQILIDKFNDRMVSKVGFLKQFLYIHPFIDGNGRTVKILMI